MFITMPPVWITGGLLFTLWTSAALADITLNPDRPERYVVTQGDTLWDIAGHFIQHPWRWPEIWHVNPQIKNPHLIYPGDIITLSYRDGRPELRLERGHPTVVLSPEVRATPLPQPVPTVPIDAIQPFLTRPLVVSERELDSAAYVVANTDSRLMSGAGDKVYARGIKDLDQTRFAVFRQGPAIKDRDEVLGYEAIYVADLELLNPGEVAVLGVRRSAMEVQPGDRVLPVRDEEVGQSFFPHAPAQRVAGRIIAIPGGHARIGRHDVVLVNLGQENSITVGDVLAVYQAGSAARDPVMKRTMELPSERAGLLMLFRVFDRVSYGLVMQATRDIRLHDRVTNPE
jgi:hypothetical protein